MVSFRDIFLKRLVPVALLTMLCGWRPMQGQSVLQTEPRDVIDSPTAGLVAKKEYVLDIRLAPRGSGLVQVWVGPVNRLAVGCSYGGQDIIGEGNITWHPQAGFQVRLRLRNETWFGPAVVLGFDSQGYGPYDDAAKRYQVKSKGIYAVFSKSFIALGPLGLHAGCNRSLEDEDGDTDLSGFVAMDKDIVGGFVLLAEYDLALNDNSHDGAYGAGHGYLNAGIRWNFGQVASLECDMKNLSNNREGVRRVGRELRFAFWDFF